MKQIFSLEERLTAKVDCNEPENADKPSCNSITDTFCGELWNKTNKGNMKVHDGELKIGWTKAGAIREYRKVDYLALTQNFSRLPKDLRLKLGNVIPRLRHAVANEKNDPGWHKRVAEIHGDIDKAIDEVTAARQKERHPEIFKKAAKDRTPEEKYVLKRENFLLQDEILEAKYKQHPNWKRVERIFPEVQKAILAEIEHMKISAERKKQMMDLVTSIELSLPYTDPERLNASPDCGTTTVNAYYTRSRHQFTACAGFFNGYQSDAAVAFIIGHEIGHSIDPNALGSHDCQQHSQVSRTLQQLVDAKGSGMDCTQWKEARSSTLGFNLEFQAKGTNEMADFYACLKEQDTLLNYTPEAVLDAVERLARQDFAAAADNNAFLELAVPSFEEGSKQKQNPFFLRPDLLQLHSYNMVPGNKLNREATLPEVFSQALSCAEIRGEDGRTKTIRDKLTSREHEALFRKAGEESYEVWKTKLKDKYAYCGKTCVDLAQEGLARKTGENFADWISARAMNQFLKDTRNAPEKSRESSALFSSLFCEENAPLSKAAPNLAAAQKEMSFLPHPQNRLRRISVYTQENADIIGCSITPEEQGYALCNP